MKKISRLIIGALWAVWAALALAGDQAHTDPTDDAWLERSRALLEQADGAQAPAWLNMDVPDEARQWADEVGARAHDQRVPAAQAPQAQSEHVLIFGSFSIPEATLRNLLDEASEPNTQLILRGVPPGSSITATIAHLKQLVGDSQRIPNVIIDPTMFRRFDVRTVPTLVLERASGAVPVTVEGAMTVEWLRRMAVTVQPGQERLGHRAESYDIGERDLIQDMQERMAAIDWNARRQQAIAEYWRKPHEFVDLPDATQPHEFSVDPSVRVTADVLDGDGHTLVAAGESFNPLDWTTLSKVIIVFRGTDPRHVARAVQAVKDAKSAGRGVILLTTAVPSDHGWEYLSELERQVAGAVYLLPPSLVDRFHLQHIPATVTARGHSLLVTELPVGVRP